jgi:hypothetical protein
MRGIAILAVAALAACSQGGDGAANNQAATKPGHRQARIGTVGIEYDATRLVIAPVTVQLPPDNEREVRGMKLIAKARESFVGTPQCPGRTLCEAEAEGGMTLTVLNQPFPEFSAPIRRTSPVTVAGRQGVSWEGRFGGVAATYTLLPVEQQTLMMIRQASGDGAPDAAALDAVVASLSFDQPEPGAKQGK